MKKIAIGLLLFSMVLFLSFNKHSKDNYQSYHSVIWADAAGYYVYNPIWFIYGNNFQNFPSDIISRTGHGFSFDEKTESVVTKYTSGVAILQLPFFLSAHFLSGMLDFPSDGFSPIYHWAVIIAGAFYGCFGLLFSFLFLKKHFSIVHSLITIAIFFLSTNLFYYTIDASGMLHAYSFFLFSVIAFLTTAIYEQPRFKKIFFLFICLALAVLIRPTNILLVLFVLFFGMSRYGGFRDRLFFLKKHWRILIISFIISFAIFIPQIIYWTLSYNSSIVYSYGNESFLYLLSPKLLSVWFSTNNGLITYSPVLIVSIIGLLILIRKKNINGIVITVIFLLASYLFASWWNYWFGCSYGARSFVEYYPLLMFPFAYMISQIKSKINSALLYAFCIACVWINMDMIYYYDGCFYGGEWDWYTYFKLLTD